MYVVQYNICTCIIFLLASLKVTGVIEQVTYTGLVGKEIKRQIKTTKGIHYPA